MYVGLRCRGCTRLRAYSAELGLPRGHPAKSTSTTCTRTKASRSCGTNKSKSTPERKRRTSPKWARIRKGGGSRRRSPPQMLILRARPRVWAESTAIKRALRATLKAQHTVLHNLQVALAVLLRTTPLVTAAMGVHQTVLWDLQAVLLVAALAAPTRLEGHQTVLRSLQAALTAPTSPEVCQAVPCNLQTVLRVPVAVPLMAAHHRVLLKLRSPLRRQYTNQSFHMYIHQR